ncbi:MAG: heavy-metal-associated domain-containing protein [Myxococcales bacterium]|nr:heavy-metal-associated domain-containing protein [Myxococcales bacterium]
METLVIGVDGMTCGGCVNSVERALQRVPGVSRVRVDLQKRQAEVDGESLDPTLLRAALEDAGYEAREA